MRVVDVRDFCIPSDENDYDELVAFADTMASIPQFDAVPIDVLDKIRAEITAISVNGQVDEHTMFIRTGDQVKQVALEIIDKYKAESEDKCKNCKYSRNPDYTRCHDCKAESEVQDADRN